MKEGCELDIGHFGERWPFYREGSGRGNWLTSCETPWKCGLILGQL